MQVDPSGLVTAAQRIAEALADVVGGDPAHPPLGADPASAGGAARLSGAAALLVATLGEQALGLAGTAAQLLNVSAGFVQQDLFNKSGLEKLGVPVHLQVFGEGAHGVGNLIPQRVKNGFPPARWPELLLKWLEQLRAADVQDGR